jgi:hypothetical protein
MKRALLFLAVAVSAALADSEEPKTQPAPLDWNAADDSPRSRALDVASDRKALGYHLRDGFWSGPVEKGRPVVVAVHLFAGNSYWFSAANRDPDTRLKISLFDRWGYAAGGPGSEGQGRATAGITAARSGRYFVRLEMTEGDKAETCMVYSYK